MLAVVLFQHLAELFCRLALPFFLSELAHIDFSEIALDSLLYKALVGCAGFACLGVPVCCDKNYCRATARNRDVLVHVGSLSFGNGPRPTAQRNGTALVPESETGQTQCPPWAIEAGGSESPAEQCGAVPFAGHDHLKPIASQGIAFSNIRSALRAVRRLTHRCGSFIRLDCADARRLSGAHLQWGTSLAGRGALRGRSQHSPAYQPAPA